MGTVFVEAARTLVDYLLVAVGPRISTMLTQIRKRNAPVNSDQGPSQYLGTYWLVIDHARTSGVVRIQAANNPSSLSRTKAV